MLFVCFLGGLAFVAWDVLRPHVAALPADGGAEPAPLDARGARPGALGLRGRSARVPLRQRRAAVRRRAVSRSAPSSPRRRWRRSATRSRSAPCSTPSCCSALLVRRERERLRAVVAYSAVLRRAVRGSVACVRRTCTTCATVTSPLRCRARTSSVRRSAASGTSFVERAYLWALPLAAASALAMLVRRPRPAPRARLSGARASGSSPRWRRLRRAARPASATSSARPPSARSSRRRCSRPCSCRCSLHARWTWSRSHDAIANRLAPRTVFGSGWERLQLEPEDSAERVHRRGPHVLDRQTGRPTSRSHRREGGVLEPARGDPLRERRRIEIDVERVPVRGDPLGDVDADRRDLARRRRRARSRSALRCASPSRPKAASVWISASSRSRQYRFTS